MSKVKTSIYIDKELWEKFKSYSSKNGLEVSNFIEEIIREAMMEEELDKIISQLIDYEDNEIDFEPIKAKGNISNIVREMRYERESGIFG